MCFWKNNKSLKPELLLGDELEESYFKKPWPGKLLGGNEKLLLSQWNLLGTFERLFNQEKKPIKFV